MSDFSNILNDFSIDIVSAAMRNIKNGWCSDIGYNSEGYSSVNIEGLNEGELFRLTFNGKDDFFSLTLALKDDEENNVVLSIKIHNESIIPEKTRYTLKKIAFDQLSKK
ncbi:MAG TPA: hypothetical protein PLH91_00565 [Tenuifilaceae bacterium]|nr:hypothetical protein [Tenuifilaceae bacterium]